MNNHDSFSKFWKESFYAFGGNPSIAIADTCIAWAKVVLMHDQALDDSKFCAWYRERGYRYADSPASSTIEVCQAWSRYVLKNAHYEPKPLIHLPKGVNESYRSWLDKHGIPFPPVEEDRVIDCPYVQYRGDLYAQVENGKFSIWFYYLPSERRWQQCLYGPH